MQFCVDYYDDLDTWHLEVQLTTPKRGEGGWSGPGPRARWGWVKFLGIYKTRDAAKAAAARLGTAILPDEELNWQEEGVGMKDSFWGLCEGERYADTEAGHEEHTAFCRRAETYISRIRRPWCSAKNRPRRTRSATI